MYIWNHEAKDKSKVFSQKVRVQSVVNTVDLIMFWDCQYIPFMSIFTHFITY